MKIVLTTLSFGKNYTKDYTCRLIDDVLKMSNIDLYITTDCEDVIKDQFGENERININKITRDDVKIRLYTNESKFGNDFFLKNYHPRVDQMVDTLSIYGNCISASIPLGLELLINNSQDTKNKKILILGSGAGLSLGALILEFS